MKNQINSVIVLMSVLTLTACSKVPQAEIDAANAAIEQASASGAKIYVYDSFIALEDSLKGVMAEIESLESKMIKNYSTVKEHLAGVTQYALEVKQQAETRQEELKMEIQNTIAEVKTLIENSRQLILEAPKGKEGTTALVAIKSELNAIEASLNETSSLFDAGDYLATLDKAVAAKDKAASIQSELNQVITKYKSAAPSKRS